jgi:histone chaperone ASF1
MMVSILMLLLLFYCTVVLFDNSPPVLDMSRVPYHLSYFCVLATTDLEWKVLYVGSAHDAAKDQVLDEVLVGPVPVGLNKFILQAEAPDIAKLPETDVLGVTVVLVTCSYKEREFVRIGFYVNNEYLNLEAEDGGDAPNEANDERNDTAAAIEAPPPPPPISIKDVDFSLVQRQILADKPRVTKFPISWGDAVTTVPSIATTHTEFDKPEASTPSTTATEMEAE